MNRSHRARIGQETVEIVQRGWYEHPSGLRIDIADDVQKAISTTTLHAPATLTTLVESIASKRTSDEETCFEVANETSLAAAKRLVVDRQLARTLCLNFASAKNPGGGFLGGSQAQEESLARSSALYASLITQQDYYERNRQSRTALYTDHIIVSPNVPVFRDDDGTLLDQPYLCSFLTVPAVNAGAIQANEPTKSSLIEPTMAGRIAKLLAVASHQDYEHLILGAWGCGVFRNDPQKVAQLFADALRGHGLFRNRFRSVVFAVLDNGEHRQIIRPFERHFGQR